MDLRAGYEVMHNLTLFAIGSGVGQYMDNSTSAGLGYGASLEYKLTQHVFLEGMYKTTDMRDSGSDYSYDTSNIALKFNY